MGAAHRAIAPLHFLNDLTVFPSSSTCMWVVMNLAGMSPCNALRPYEEGKEWGVKQGPG